MKRSAWLKLFLTTMFLIVSIASSSHAAELYYNHCDETASVGPIDHGSNDIENHFLPTSPEQDDCDCTDHQHRCCHHHSFLPNSQVISLLDSDKLIIGVPPQGMISDPHSWGPFQPPKI